MKKQRKLVGILLSLILLMGTSNVVLASAPSPEVTFDAEEELFTYKNVETYVTEKNEERPNLFTAEKFEMAIPGDSLMQNIVFKTQNMKGKTVHIYLHSENASEEYQEIMNSATFTVTYNNKVISEGTLEDGIKIGTFTSDETKDIQVEFHIPLEVDNRISKLYGTIDWVFVAELIEDETETGKNPETGDYTNYLGWIVLAVAGLVGIVVIRTINNKKRKEQ